MVLILDNSPVLLVGDPLPTFILPAANGNPVNSRDLSDPVLVIVFTCNHCPYAKAYEDRLVTLAQEFSSKGVAFVLINSNDASDFPEDSFENMKALAEQKQYPFPYCRDESQDVAKTFGAVCTPHCFVFDKARTLRYKGRVDDNWKEPEKVTKRDLLSAIGALVAGEDPPESEANAIGCSIKWKPGNEPSYTAKKA